MVCISACPREVVDRNGIRDKTILVRENLLCMSYVWIYYIMCSWLLLHILCIQNAVRDYNKCIVMIPPNIYSDVTYHCVTDVLLFFSVQCREGSPAVVFSNGTLAVTLTCSMTLFIR